MSIISEMCYSNMSNRNRGIDMKDNSNKNARRPLDKSEQKKEDEFVNVFKYFENANVRNRDAFCELLDYTIENKGDIHE
jgi:hypothetical protein